MGILPLTIVLLGLGGAALSLVAVSYRHQGGWLDLADFLMCVWGALCLVCALSAIGASLP